MGMGGEAPWAMGVMWLMCGLVFLFMLLRVYTRVVCVASYGIDDHVYIVAFIFLLVFTIFTQMSAEIGFGQTLVQLNQDMDKVTKATLYECIGQGFAIIGMAIAKCSLGFFLLRLVSVLWQKIVVYSAMTLVFLASVAQLLCFWLSCVPLKFVYDKRIHGGTCPIDTRPTSYILCDDIVSTVIVDSFFALFPWAIVWNLQMPKREKYTITCSMSLGLIAAAAGIKRTTEVEGLYTPDYLADSVGLIVWSSVEMAVTMICIGIPVCMPLYKSIYRRMRSQHTSSGYQKHSQEPGQEGGSLVALRTIGGGYVNKDGQTFSKSHESNPSRDAETSFSNMKLGVKGTTTHTIVGRGRPPSSAANTSDEEILGDEYRQSAQQHTTTGPQDDGGRRGAGITVTKSYRVDN